MTADDYIANETDLRERCLKRLRRDLRTALADVARADVDEEEIITGDDIHPGIWRNAAGELEAWAHDPVDLANPLLDCAAGTLQVSESDLHGEDK